MFYIQALMRGLNDDSTIYMALYSAANQSSYSKDIFLDVINLSRRLSPTKYQDQSLLRGEIYLKLSDYQNSRLEFKSCCDRDPMNRKCWYNIGFNLFMDDDYSSTNNLALTAFHKVIDISSYLYPDEKDDYNKQAHLFRGIIFSEINKNDSAMLEFNMAIGLDKKYAEAYSHRGMLKSELGDYSGSISDLTKSLSIDSSDTYTYFSRGYSFEKKGEYRNALLDYEHAIREEKYSDEISAMYGNEYGNKKLVSKIFMRKAFVYMAIGEQTEACNALSQAGELGVTNAYDLIKSQCNTKTNDKNVVSLIKSEGGVYEIPVTINEVLKIAFIFDSGASDVFLSADIAMTLIKTGTITDADFVGSQRYLFADGTSANSDVILLKSIQIGNKTIYGVRATISKSIKSPMLLGQSVLQRFGKFTINNSNHTVTFE
jgi:clan AA aspartic protease (TIGR02281 family)